MANTQLNAQWVNETPQIDINVIFDIYGEEGEDILQYALSAFCLEASKYVAQLHLAVAKVDEVEASRLFHSLKTMSAMIGARQLSRLCAELEMLLLKSTEFELKYDAFLQLWPLILTELEQHLGH